MQTLSPAPVPARALPQQSSVTACDPNLYVPSTTMVQEESLDNLRAELESTMERKLGVFQEMLEIAQNGTPKSSKGNDMGFLKHTENYYNQRMVELKTAIAESVNSSGRKKSTIATGSILSSGSLGTTSTSQDAPTSILPLPCLTTVSKDNSTQQAAVISVATATAPPNRDPAINENLFNPRAEISLLAANGKGKGKENARDTNIASQAVVEDDISFEEDFDIYVESSNILPQAAVGNAGKLLRPLIPLPLPLPAKTPHLQKPVQGLGQLRPASSSSVQARLPITTKSRHPWSRDVYKALRQRFGLKGFREQQEQAIDATLSGKDVFVLLPTGGGKSLCFQLPAVINTGVTRGVTIVVSPLLSLISDQTKALRHKDIPVIFLSSTMPSDDRRHALAVLQNDPPQTCLAYVTPEQIVKSEAFRKLLTELYRRNQLARFVIDEAHCVSSWGHDFRPDYKEMGSLKKDFPRIPLIALTATANDRVKRDVMVNLNMHKDTLMLTQSFNRPNLRYEVRPKVKLVLAEIATFINSQHRGECGIIYCHSKKQCEDTADKLRREYRIDARHYHAGMDKHDREDIQDGWQHGKFHVICATIAFGMGIDKPDVRYVIHYSLSQSLEAYYQETGRAGRDGKTSVCVLFFSYGDTKLINRLIDDGDGTREQKENNRANLQRVVQYCLNTTDCRRSQVLGYFGENFPKSACHKTCDNCLNGTSVTRRDVTEFAQEAIRLVQSIEHDKGVTMLHAIDVFRGSKSAKITQKGHDKLPYAGKGASMDRGDVERLFQLMASVSALGERFERNGLGFTNAYVCLGKKFGEVLSGTMKLSMAFSDSSSATITTKTINTVGHVAKVAHGASSSVQSKPPPKPAVAKRTKEYVSNPIVTDSDDDEIGYWDPTPDQNSNASRPFTNANEVPEGSNERCFKELLAIRQKSAAQNRLPQAQLIPDDALQMVAAVLPKSYSEFVAIEGCQEEHFEWFVRYGGKEVCLRYGQELNKPSVPKSKLILTELKMKETRSDSSSNLNRMIRARATPASSNPSKSSKLPTNAGLNPKVALQQYRFSPRGKAKAKGRIVKTGKAIKTGSVSAIRPMTVNKR